ncbi:MAG TPA: hypothetical protein VMN04_08635 [Thermoanaerobaculia bacterium]|nr:hypothetical protein [Thermoanaerobaculia bacterium]
MSGTRSALGLRVHSGWAAAVVVAGAPGALSILDRRRLVLADGGDLPGSKQPYHALEGREGSDARTMRERFVEDARRRAVEELRTALRDAAAAGHALRRCGLLLASGRPLPELSRVLASHALIHTADGVHFRDALAHAAGSLSLKVVSIPEREAEARAAAAAGVPAEELRSRIAGLGKTLGPPWTQDEKLAALAGLLALAAG